MNTLRGVVDLLREPGMWAGSNSVPMRLVEHIGYSLVATVVAAGIALPIALWLGHTGRGGLIAIQVANVGRAVPTFGVLILAFTLVGYGITPVYIALVLLAIPPLVTNTYVGVRQVDADVRQAAEGMGMTGLQVLRRIEVPVATPLIMTGLRTTAVQVVATATLAAIVGLGGLGRYIVDGIAQGAQFNLRARALVIVGAVLVALLAVATELVMERVERRLTSPGLRPSGVLEDTTQGSQPVWGTAAARAP
jgi:osmoprotectant transport system permease protein